MIKINRLAVFCGSSHGTKESYANAVKLFAKTLCEKNMGLVYGGANVGLMKVLADSMLEFNGDAIGVIPQFLVDYEIAHEEIAELHVVDSLSERKFKMAELADGFVLLPGGVGSLDEFFEMVTWSKLRLHNKPCAILNTDGFYNSLMDCVNHMVTEGFLEAIYKERLICEEDPLRLIEALQCYSLPAKEMEARLVETA